jgi:cobaltochelatase CobS
MTHHASFPKVKLLVDNKIPVLLTGDAGSGKTTLAEHVANAMELKFHSLSMTRQTTLSHILGFISVNGTYVPSTLRKCFDEEGDGGLMLIDEMDAGDPNVLLCLNTIENGYISFPDGLVRCHPNFRIVATCNPQDQHNKFTGRSKLDASTLDRYDTIDVERDDLLEKSLVDVDTHNRMQLLRKIMGRNNSSKSITMRDAIRYQQRKDLNILDDAFVYRLTDKADLVLEQYKAESGAIPKHQDQSECSTFQDLVDLLEVRAEDLTGTKKSNPQPEQETDDD